MPRAASRSPHNDAATLKIPAAAPAAWGVAPASLRARRRTGPIAARLVSTRMLALALTLFGVGCAGGSAWLGSTLVLPRPATITSELVTPARTLSKKLAVVPERRAAAVLAPAAEPPPPARAEASIGSQRSGAAACEAARRTGVRFLIAKTSIDEARHALSRSSVSGGLGRAAPFDA